jgi:uroporphyrinogen decarboxylase
LSTIIEPLQKDEVIKAIERNYPSRIPLIRAKWWGEGLREQYQEKLNELDRFPEDVVWILMDNPANPDIMNLSWHYETDNISHDARCIIDNWSKLDEFIEKLPDPDRDGRLGKFFNIAEKAKSENRYVLYGWWCLFFEKPWSLRGMQNLMIDYYENPDKVQKLHGALAEVYCQYINYANLNFNPDGFWTSDDLGHQKGAMISPGIFKDFIYPYYRKIGDLLKNKKMHFWLHSCGDNTSLLPLIIETGVDIFHPVQKHTMDEKIIAQKYGDKLTFLAGIDVQHTLQEKDEAGVREEVRFLIDTFDRQDGGLCLAAGNGIVAGTPFENIEAFLDEALKYGMLHRATSNIKNILITG